MIIAALVIYIIGTILSAIQLKDANHVYNNISIYSSFSLVEGAFYIIGTASSIIGIIVCPIMAALCVYLLVIG